MARHRCVKVDVALMHKTGCRLTGPGRAVALALQGQSVGAVSEPVEGGGAKQSVGEGVAPLGEVEVGGDDGGALFVSFGDEVVEVLVLRCSQGFQTEAVDLCSVQH